MFKVQSLDEVVSKFHTLSLETPSVVSDIENYRETDTASVVPQFDTVTLDYKKFASIPKLISTDDWTTISTKSFLTDAKTFLADAPDIADKYRIIKACPYYVFSFQSAWSSTGLMAINWLPYTTQVLNHFYEPDLKRSLFDLSAFPVSQCQFYRLGEPSTIVCPLPWVSEYQSFKVVNASPNALDGIDFPVVNLDVVVPIRHAASEPQLVTVTVYRGWYGLHLGEFRPGFAK